MSSTYTYSLFFRDQYLGQGVGRLRQRDARLFPPDHIAFFCNSCGEIWARAVADTETAKWMVLAHTCDRCGIGRINLEYWIGDDAKGPLDWLKREFLLALEHGERYWTWHHMSHARYAKFKSEPVSDFPTEPITAQDFVNVPEF